MTDSADRQTKKELLYNFHPSLVVRSVPSTEPCIRRRQDLPQEAPESHYMLQEPIYDEWRADPNQFKSAGEPIYAQSIKRTDNRTITSPPGFAGGFSGMANNAYAQENKDGYYDSVTEDNNAIYEEPKK